MYPKAKLLVSTFAWNVLCEQQKSTHHTVKNFVIIFGDEKFKQSTAICQFFHQFS